MDRDNRFSDLDELIDDFISERDWGRYHRPKDISMALSIEAGELLELYLWDRKPEKGDIEDEVADVFFFLLDICIREDIDLEWALRKKIDKNREKYPVELVKGKDHKYTKYREE